MGSASVPSRKQQILDHFFAVAIVNFNSKANYNK